jgi:anhydro-N-acetylmuramic acid kinase
VVVSKIFKCIGLMSGTSLDGMDVALLETDGESLVKRGPSATYAYDQKQQQILRQALVDALEIQKRTDRPASLAETESKLTQWHAEAVRKFLKDFNLSASNIDAIGFHGQTVLHKPEVKLTVQLGDGQALAKATNIDVVYDMRASDIAAGGQGAPLVPIYHAAIAPSKPCAIVNIGGVGNVTFIGSDGELIAFDTGPGNALINDWMMKHKSKPYDEGGKVCLAGQASQSHLDAAMAHPYFAKQPPKSLDRNSFIKLDFADLSFENGAATLAAFTAQSIAASAKLFTAKPTRWVVCGGGRYNVAIMKKLGELLPNVISAEAANLNGDSMEADAWAYLAARSLKGLPLTYPGTTGVSQPMTGGVLAKA